MASIKFANTYSTAGLDVDKLPKLQEAIKAYTTKLNKLADQLDTTKNTEWNAVVRNAIKGANAEASAKSYITSICTECRNQIKLLTSLSTALSKLEAKYKKHDTSCTDIVYQPIGPIGPSEPIYVAYKPIIYLYPEEETKLEITVGKPEELLSTYPKYNNGWKVTAHQNGDLYDESGNYYYSLFWDGKDETVENFEEGFVVEGKKTSEFLREKLEYIGLNGKETNEFINFWLPKLETNKFNLIRFRQTEEVNEYMPLNISKTPDTLIRVLMDFKGLDEKIEVRPQELTSTERKGFVVVEWGGRTL